MKRIYHHVDFRVRDRATARAFYDPLMTALGLEHNPESEAWDSYYRSGDGDDDGWFAFTEDAQMAAGSNRVAFQADSRADVDRVAALLAGLGAGRIERDDGLYGPDYYAVFFEDPDGNKLEVCCVTA